MSEHGHVVDVQILKLGDALVSDTAAGATQLVVGDIADFDEDGGTLYLNGEVLTYSAADDDTSTITLTTATTIAAESGDSVNVWDTRLEAVATEHVAFVEVDSEGEGDTIEATVEQHLIDEIPTGIRGLRGESVRMESEDDDWRVVDILGKANGGVDGSDSSGSTAIKFRNLDAFVLLGDGSQDVELTYTPINGSEHVYWNGLQQRRTTDWVRTGNTVTILGTEAREGDTIDVEYAYIDAGESPPATAPAVTEKFYLPASGPAAVTPAYSAKWDDTTQADRVAMGTTLTDTTNLSESASETAAGATDVLIRQYIGPANLDAGTISGSFRTSVMAFQSVTDADMFLNMIIGICSSDGTVIRGLAYAGQPGHASSADPDAPNYEFATSVGQSRILTDTFDPVSGVQDGDRWFVEYGFSTQNANTTGRTGSLMFGDELETTDLPFTVDAGGSITHRPWLEITWEAA